MKDYATEEAALIELLEISKKHDIDSWFSSSLDYGELLEFQKRNAGADAIYVNLNSIKPKLNQSKGYFVYMNDTGRLATKLKNYEEAEQIFSTLLSHEKKQVKVDTFHLSFIYKSLTHLYEDTGDYKKAFENNQK